MLVKLELSRQIFGGGGTQIPNFMNIRAGGSPPVLCGQTDEYEEANGSFSQPCEHAQKPKASMY